LAVRKGKFSPGRRMFLMRAGGVGAGAAGGEALFQGLSALSTGAIQAVERTATELYHDISLLSGSLENEISRVKSDLEDQYAANQERLKELDLPALVNQEDISELLDNLTYLEQRYTFVERLLQFKDRMHNKLIHLDAAIEDIEPDVFRTFGDAIRGLHGKPSGEEYRRLRDDLLSKLDLLARVYTSTENTRRIEASLAEDILSSLKELNTLLDSPELDEVREEFGQMMRSHLNKKLPESLGEPEGLPSLADSLSEEELAKLQELMDSMLIHARRLETVFASSKKVQQLLADGELTLSQIRNSTAKRGSGEASLFQYQLNQLENRAKAIVIELTDLGLPLKLREERINHDTLSSGISETIGGALGQPVRWASWALCGGIGWIIGARISRSMSNDPK
jgi:hypothetical protein